MRSRFPPEKMSRMKLRGYGCLVALGCRPLGLAQGVVFAPKVTGRISGLYNKALRCNTLYRIANLVMGCSSKSSRKTHFANQNIMQVHAFVLLDPISLEMLR